MELAGFPFLVLEELSFRELKWPMGGSKARAGMTAILLLS